MTPLLPFAFGIACFVLGVVVTALAMKRPKVTVIEGFERDEKGHFKKAVQRG